MKTLPLLPAALIVTLLALLANTWSTRQAAPVPVTAPLSDFSGERAMNLLNAFLAENEPHPVGSAANRRVKQRIQRWLDEQGIAHEEQAAWGCSARRAACSHVENIIARLPGAVDGPYVALMAHYDSTPHAPGAGDDMAGVVAVLETARAIKARGGFRHPILLLLTDAEETGLHGAEAFFGQHPLAPQIRVLLNVEGAGTRGPSLVLRTSMANAWYMSAYRDLAAQPAGTSLVNEIFKRMPNDTDFSVAMRAEVPGIDFSFAVERNHYHTPNDSPANLDPRTVQHHGDNLFPLALALANMDLEAEHAGRVVYAGAYGWWAQWPQSATAILLGVAALLLIAAGLRWDAGPAIVVLHATVFPALLLALGGVLVHQCFAFLERANGVTVGWPAHPWAFRIVIWAAMLLPALVLGPLFQRRVAFGARLLGAWWFLWLLSLGVFLFAPDAAPALLIAVLPAALLLAVLAWLPLPPAWRDLLSSLTLAAPVLFLYAATLLEATQGLHVLPAIWPWVGLFAVTAVAFARGPGSGWAALVGILVLPLGMLLSINLPLYSEQRPQHLNVWYLQEADAPAARLHLQAAGDLPPTMAGMTGFTDRSDTLFPWSDERRPHQAEAVSAALPAPSLSVEEDRPVAGGRRLRLRLRSERDAAMLRLALPAAAGDWTGEVEGVPIKRASVDGSETPAFTQLRVHGVQGRDVRITLEVESAGPLKAWLADYSHTLPGVAEGLRMARPTTAVPQHWGDTAVVYREVTF